MNRRKFISIAGASVITIGAGGYLLSDKSNFSRADINESIQFLLRVGYLKNYPPPVSLHRPVEWFLRN